MSGSTLFASTKVVAQMWPCLSTPCGLGFGKRQSASPISQMSRLAKTPGGRIRHFAGVAGLPDRGLSKNFLYLSLSSSSITTGSLLATRAHKLIISEESNNFAQLLSEITGISRDCLCDPHHCRNNATIGERMSWASARETTLREDKAYSLATCLQNSHLISWAAVPLVGCHVSEQITTPHHGRNLFFIRLNCVFYETLDEYSCVLAVPLTQCPAPAGGGRPTFQRHSRLPIMELPITLFNEDTQKIFPESLHSQSFLDEPLQYWAAPIPPEKRRSPQLMTHMLAALGRPPPIPLDATALRSFADITTSPGDTIHWSKSVETDIGALDFRVTGTCRTGWSLSTFVGQ
ncbi:hypothetical protein B0T17DRAFT_648706 [Bombardia bombarda]|uniref:Uncharacterized protein n=1 Tax=Bombardia bombarda TaxID=252184 RepID=A0AA39U769_9PEZI|nr:hypothetical protein B0T17DRAFT_648706 [Bombardia bombarda]